MQSTLTTAAPLVDELADLLIGKKWSITTAESCTGGLLAAALTDRAGSSEWFGQSVVSYSNDAKMALLAVDESLLVQYGAVSQPVVEAMANGALSLANADVAVSISGIAGPGGGTLDKPVGTVWIGWAMRSLPGANQPANQSVAEIQSASYYFEGDRSTVRACALLEALRGTIHRVATA